MTKVSVIIITYNRPDFLPRAVMSVLNQTFQDFELLVVDDASEDNRTREVMEQFCDGRVRYMRHDCNRGEAGARNTGLCRAMGEYIAFLDDDDEWLPDKLQRQVEVLKNSPTVVGVVYSGVLRVDSATNSTLSQTAPAHRGNVFSELLRDNWITLSTVLARRACFEKVGLFDERIPFGLDWDMWIRISGEFQFEYVDAPLVKYFLHPKTLSNNQSIVISGIEALNQKYDQLFARRRKDYSYRFLTLGVLYCYSGNTRKGRENFLKAIRLYPFEVRHYFNLCLSFLGQYSFRQVKQLRDRMTATELSAS